MFRVFCCCSSKDMTLALLYPLEMGNSATVVQQALVLGLTAAMHRVLHMLPLVQQGSTYPSVSQVLQAQQLSCMAAT
jgi:hypothetical protein